MYKYRAIAATQTGYLSDRIEQDPDRIRLGHYDIRVDEFTTVIVRDRIGIVAGCECTWIIGSSTIRP
jgi:hypothetical protein